MYNVKLLIYMVFSCEFYQAFNTLHFKLMMMIDVPFYRLSRVWTNDLVQPLASIINDPGLSNLEGDTYIGCNKQPCTVSHNEVTIPAEIVNIICLVDSADVDYWTLQLVIAGDVLDWPQNIKAGNLLLGSTVTEQFPCPACLTLFSREGCSTLVGKAKACCGQLERVWVLFELWLIWDICPSDLCAGLLVSSAGGGFCQATMIIHLLHQNKVGVLDKHNNSGHLQGIIPSWICRYDCTTWICDIGLPITPGRSNAICPSSPVGMIVCTYLQHWVWPRRTWKGIYIYS